MFQNALKCHGEKTALVFDGKKVSYQTLWKEANRVGRALSRLGVRPNTRVALMMSNSIEYVVSDLGLMFAGGTKVPLNDMLGEKEIAHILKDSGAKVVIASPNFFRILTSIRQDLTELTTIVGVADKTDCPNGFISWTEFQAGEGEEEIHTHVSPEDMAFIAYTGGTTGVPKGVVHSQQNMVLNLFSHIIEMGLLDDERILLMSPLPHSAGMVLLSGLLKGATHFVERKFDPQLVLNRIDHDKITLTFMVPTMIYRVMDQIEDRTYDFTSLRTIVYGAAPITTERLKQGLEIFGPVFMQLYGQTEAPNFVTRLRKEDHSLDPKQIHKLRSCGQSVLMSQVRIVNENDEEVGRGVEGEIVTRTAYNMVGYYNQPEKTRETLRGGWLHTGDIGMMDEDGYVYLLDRKKDIIISGGMNVYTTEVENAIQTHPDVAQVAVIGIPHSDWGEAVIAFVVPSPGRELTAAEILEHCQQLSSYKRPKDVKIVSALPLTPYGKIDKKALRKPFWEGHDRQVN
jgi:fatty-acyl-CoA synthase